MSAVDALRDKAAKLANQLKNAEAAAEQAALGRHARNVERRTAFWSDAGDRCTAALRSADAARVAVVDLVAAGDVTGALDAYAAYVRAVGASQVLVRAAQDATATYVYPARRVVKEADNPRRTGGTWVGQAEYENYEARTLRSEWIDAVPPSQYRTEYGKGVPEGYTHDPVPFVALLETGTGQLLAAHSAAFRAELLAPLKAELEPED